jgi:hypothetical protein
MSFEYVVLNMRKREKKVQIKRIRKKSATNCLHRPGVGVDASEDGEKTLRS